MIERDRSCVQRDTPVLLTTPRTVLHIAFYRMPCGTQLRSYLVERTTVGNYFHQGIAVTLCQHFHRDTRLLS